MRITAIVFALACVFSMSCGDDFEWQDNPDFDGGSGGDSDSDADADADGDADADADADADTDGDADTDTDADADADTDADTDADADSDSDTDTSVGSLQGTVLAPSQIFPVSGALVYLSKSQPSPIPDQVYNYECGDVGDHYTLSGSDGTWKIDNVPVGTWNIVTRKGNFRLAREIVVEENEDRQVPQDFTTLPGSNNAQGDTIPNFAVLYTTPDLIYNLLAKFGMGNVGAGGVLQRGTEEFDLYTDGVNTGGYPTSEALFATEETIEQYHMLFLPCLADTRTVPFITSHAAAIRSFVSKGGKIYNSCCVALWTEAPFPDYVDFSGGNPDPVNRFDIGRIVSTGYSTTGEILDNQLASWIDANTTYSPTSFPFTEGYVKIDGVTEVADSHGLSKDNGVVKPYVWVRDTQRYPGLPLIVSYNYDFGKVLYTVFETSGTSTTLSSQEYALMYVILEMGVCNDLPEV